jgi:hypothetical protein
MKLPWKTRTQTSVPGPEDHPSEVFPRFEIHRSPGLEAALAGLSRQGAIRILDLGPAIVENVDFFSNFAARIQIVDALRDSVDPEPAIAVLRRLASESEAGFHLVLLWDCLNYLSPAQGAALVSSVMPLCCPDARCLAMAVTSDTMPASPTRYRIVDDRHLNYERSTTDVMGAPQMTPVVMEELLVGFSIEHAFVLRNGIREFVAIRDAAGAELPG